jgi:hypothetical protein
MREQGDAERATLITRKRRRDRVDLTTPCSLRATVFFRETRASTFSPRSHQRAAERLS